VFVRNGWSSFKPSLLATRTPALPTALAVSSSLLDSNWGPAVALNAGVMVLTDSKLSNNYAVGSSGGGVHAVNSSALSISDSILLGNRADVSGGGLWTKG
jgi:hypothetical protein